VCVGELYSLGCEKWLELNKTYLYMSFLFENLHQKVTMM